MEPLILNRITVPDSRGFHASTVLWSENKYICVYHNSESHRLASCFLDEQFNVIIGSHTEDLQMNLNIDPRLCKYNNRVFMSTSQVLWHPDFIELYELEVTNKITVIKASKISLMTGIKDFPQVQHCRQEKNWTPWQHNDKFLYTYSMNPHIIFEVDIG